MRLRGRLERLERRLGPVGDYPMIVALDIPGGRLDTALVDGEERAVTEALVQELGERGYVIQTVGGIDPCIATGKTLVDT
jgi:hypothetical protein